MRIDHFFRSKHCQLVGCTKPIEEHRKPRKGLRPESKRKWDRENVKPLVIDRIIGIDGEALGRDPHNYCYIAAADEKGQTWTLSRGAGIKLTPEECLDFLLALPRRALKIGFAFLYDLSKMLQDLPDDPLFLLFHEKWREEISYGPKGPFIKTKPVSWGKYKLQYRNRKFTVSSGNRRTTVWDVFAFFQAKFTKACIDWGIGDAESIQKMEDMKERRAILDSLPWEKVMDYCNTECVHLATLGRQLLNAHVNAGFPLKEYYGAGSTAKALMNKYNVRNFIGEIPDAMKEPVACAFFGGRFENSVAGAIRRKVWNADINSAYPYAATFLPCLIHGSWRFQKRPGETDLEKSTLALINWSMPGLQGYERQSDKSRWGPFPVRVRGGSIIFPLGGSSGWVWRNEFLAGRAIRKGVAEPVALGAWLYTTDCHCKPFSFLPEVYLERLKLGSDSRGIVLKLGPNSVYGKLVQSVGFRPPFQCWVWGGNITSGCRAQCLEFAAKLPSLDNLLMIATDGCWTDVEPMLPKPLDTGTNDAYKINPKKGPLGAWDVKDYERGVFAGRPGIYFPIDPSNEDIAKVRARGLGRKVLYERWRSVVQAWRMGKDRVEVPGGTRFVGAKSGLRLAPGGVVRHPKYGEWIDWPIQVSFNPLPKRCGMVRNKNFPQESRLVCHDYIDEPSLPYENAVKSEEDKLLEIATLIMEEQPNTDFEQWMEETDG